MARKPKKDLKSPHYRKHRERILAKMNQRYLEDAAFRKRARAKARKRYHENEAYRLATLERARKRYHAHRARLEKARNRPARDQDSF